jgi:hypothetical protein
MLTVRVATVLDEDEIFFLLLEMAKENSDHKVSVSKSIAAIREIIKIGGAAVVEDGKRIVGSVGVSPQSPWFSNEKFLGDSWFYVEPRKRGSRAAVMLKKAVQVFADRVGMDLVLAVFSTVAAERKSAFFARDMAFLGGAYRYKSKGI